MPENFLPEYPFKDYIGAGKNLRDERLAPFPRTEYAVKVNRQEYYAIITHMDQQIGRILEALEKTGKKEETYIFYSADHGLAVGQHGLLGKQNLYDHSVRVPFIVSGPDLQHGKQVDTPIYLQDVTASTLDLAGIEKPDHVEFSSVMSLARGDTNQHPYDAIYGAYLQLQRSVTMDGFKLIVYPKAVRTRLYNVEDDPLEQHDLANDAAYEKTKQKLFQRLLELQDQMGDKLDLRSVFANI
jgi:arylsulfatase A-like enzyme